ncbi:MAG: metallophosphoesterase [Gammaproteobacteria bacterium]|nr:metallophosphoesterase [Gammaproteobacteria bacterium]
MTRDSLLAGSHRALMRACTLLLAVVLLPACVVADTHPQAERVVAISDVHGAYDSMVRTLRAAGIVGEDLAWAAGATKLVITGDLLDRGADSRKVMDLVMQLEDEAPDSGGQVHLLLGNHEVMNLIGDLRYVAKGEYAAFAADEVPEDREKWFRHYFENLNSDDSEEAARARFNELAPPGFFEHRRAFAANGHYGKWLLEKPLIAVINGSAFVHGGLPPLVAELGLDGVNDKLGAELSAYTRQMNLLNDAGLLNPIVNYYDHPGAIRNFPIDPMRSRELMDAGKRVIDLHESSINNADGPLWYRGTVGCGPLIESERLDAALDALGAERVVIGHTPTLTRQVLQRLDGRVIEIDTGMLQSAYQGVGNALLIEGDRLSVFNEVTGPDATIAKHPRRVGLRAESLSAADLAGVLSGGEITEMRADEQGREFVDFENNGQTITAEFIRNPRGRGFVPELAAYRLDLMLGLDMVPVTVAREIDGKKGVLQFVPAGLSNETLRSAAGHGGSAWCPIVLQWPVMYVWDTLVYNPGRRAENILYSTDNWQLILNAHQESFSTKRGRPPWLQKAELDINDGWLAALQELTDERLQEQLGDVLGKRRISALGKRRDELLAGAAR